MSVITVRDGALVRKDPVDVKNYSMDWDALNLAPAATIVTSNWTITARRPSTTDTALTKDQEAVLVGDRKTLVRLSAGTLGQTYEIANAIVTDEVPPQTKERSFFVLVENL